MKAKHSRAWWREAVRRWKRSRLEAEEFAAAEGVKGATLRWWRTQLRTRKHIARRPSSSGRGRRDRSRARRGVALQIRVTEAKASAPLTITIGSVAIVVEPGTDLEYVTALLSRLRG